MRYIVPTDGGGYRGLVEAAGIHTTKSFKRQTDITDCPGSESTCFRGNSRDPPVTTALIFLLGHSPSSWPGDAPAGQAPWESIPL